MNVNGIHANTVENKTSFEKITNVKSGTSVNEDVKKATDSMKENRIQVKPENLGKKFNGIA